MTTPKPATINEYIAGFPTDIQAVLQQVRQTIRKAAPEAEESIAYGLPAFTLNGPLIYFGAFKGHIGFYATPTGHEAFQQELSPYKQGKGSVQFPLDRPMPLDLITRMVKFRVAENLAKVAKKKAEPGKH